MSQLCWQHAKIISPNKNPPERSKGVININSSAHEDGIDLGPVHRAKALETVNFRFFKFSRNFILGLSYEHLNMDGSKVL